MQSTKTKQEDLSLISSARAAQLSGYSQDYIGQLCRSGSIDCRRVLGEWRIDLQSVLAYKKRFNPDFKPTTEVETSSSETGSITTVKDGHTEIFTKEGIEYISSAKAAQLTGYTQDYVGQLARSDTLPAQKVGRKWFVGKTDLIAHKKHNDDLLASLQKDSLGINKPLDSKEFKHTIPIVTYKRDDGSTIVPSTVANTTVDLPKDNTIKSFTKEVSQIKVHDLRKSNNTRLSPVYKDKLPSEGLQTPHALSRNSISVVSTNDPRSRPILFKFIPKLILLLEIIWIIFMYLQFNTLNSDVVLYLQSLATDSTSINLILEVLNIDWLLKLLSGHYVY